MIINVRSARQGEEGATLILALVFLLAVALVITALAGFAISATSNSINLKQARSTLIDVESAVTAAIAQQRTSYTNVYAGSAVLCTPSQGPANTVVYCSGRIPPGSTSSSRIVDFYGCGSHDTQCTSSTDTNIGVFAEVTFDDIPPGEAPSANTCAPNVPSIPAATCGISMQVDLWDVRTADS